jgi:hypothetical protein
MWEPSQIETRSLRRKLKQRAWSRAGWTTPNRKSGQLLLIRASPGKKTKGKKRLSFLFYQKWSQLVLRLV